MSGECLRDRIHLLELIYGKEFLYIYIINEDMLSCDKDYITMWRKLKKIYNYIYFSHPIFVIL